VCKYKKPNHNGGNMISCSTAILAAKSLQQIVYSIEIFARAFAGNFYK